MLKKNEVTKIPCNVHPEFLMISAYNQDPPKRKKEVVHLICKDCYDGPGDGYRLKGVPGEYYFQYDKTHLTKPVENDEEDGLARVSKIDCTEPLDGPKEGVRGRKPSTIPKPVNEGPKRKPGRPRKNPAKTELTEEQQKILNEAYKLLGETPQIKRGRGRPPGSKNKQKM